ncbi:MAG: hypothetical protein J6A27_00945 [Bacteroidales bacterium]|nr:hypothetical protein [Bacteroidales bacterium]
MIERLFYYTSERIVVAQKMVKATGEQWMGVLNGKISKEEDKILGLEEYLKRNSRNMITKEDLIAQIKMNRLHLEEHVLEGEGINTLRLQYATPGLTNYKEIVIASPDIARYRTDDVHFTDVADDRTICWCRCADMFEGDKKILLIDEMQSSRHQDAREYGYDTDLQPNYYSYNVIEKLLADAADVGDYMARLEKYINSVVDYETKLELSIPDAPFHKWWEFLSKRMLHYAVYNGYDSIRIVGGEKQMRRYTLGSGNKGLQTLYDDVIMGYFKKYLKKWKIRPVYTSGYWNIYMSDELKHDIINLLQPLFRLGAAVRESDKYVIDEDIMKKMSMAGIEPLDVAQVQDNRTILGFYDGAYDKIYVIPANHVDVNDLSNTIVHEVIGHRGLKNLMGSRYNAFLNAIYHDVMDPAAKKVYMSRCKNKYVAAEEFCADALEKLPEESSIVSRIIGTIRLWLFKSGWNIKMSEHDLYCLLSKSYNSNRLYAGYGKRNGKHL